MKRLNGMIAVCVWIVVFLPGFLWGAEITSSLPQASHFSKKYTTDLSDILTRRYIRVLTTFNKTNYFEMDGRLFGFEYSLLKAYEKFLNQNIKRHELSVVLECIPVSRDRLISGLVEGIGDITAAGLTLTPDRSELVNFTIPYLTGVDEVIVTHKRSKKPQSKDALSGRNVYVRESSAYYESLVALNEKLLNAGKEPVRIIKVDENLETEDILELVNAGAIDMTVSDSHIAEIWSSIFKNILIHR